MESEEKLRRKYEQIFLHLDERQRRILAAADAERLGYGGVSIIARTSGLSRPTIHKGLRELHEAPLDRARHEGGGRKNSEEIDPTLIERLEELIDPATRGDPMSPLRWVSKSTRHLSEALEAIGYPVSHTTIAKILQALGYSLQGNAKNLEVKNHPDRNAQFEYINRVTKRFMRNDCPIISVDAKKKELIGKYKQQGKEWQKKGNPEQVMVHDFIDPKLGKAIPYGIYDVAEDVGWVNVGTDHDTASFAVESIRRWWKAMGNKLYDEANSLLICADGGGSNSHRSRLWKFELQQFANEFGMELTVCHFPPGTSKWNKIEHRLFSHITMNWRGRPLVSHDVVVNLIGSTRTNSGLRVKAKLDKRKYPLGQIVPEEEMQSLSIKKHSFHGEWNYKISPQKL
jgi:DNA-binding phage protein